MSNFYAPEEKHSPVDRQPGYMVEVRIAPDGSFGSISGSPDAVAMFDNWLRRNQDRAIQREYEFQEYRSLREDED